MRNAAEDTWYRTGIVLEYVLTRYGPSLSHSSSIDLPDLDQLLGIERELRFIEGGRPHLSRWIVGGTVAFFRLHVDSGERFGKTTASGG